MTEVQQLVVHCKRSPFDVYIGRPSKWGNPFVLGRDGDRHVVLEKYCQWLAGQPELIEQAKAELKGKVLGCWCAPKACHGDVLSAVANAAIEGWVPAAIVAGDRVRFVHEFEIYDVERVAADGMIELKQFVGRFGGHLFVKVASK